MNNTFYSHVVAGVLINAQGEVLIARRHECAHQGGLWEFPGGKREAGESVKQALIRELQEEIGILVQQAHPLIRIYATAHLLLDVWQVEQWQGQPFGREGQPIEWVMPQLLKNRQFPHADYPVITALQLPSLYLITPNPENLHDKVFFYNLEQSLEAGIQLVQLRATNLSEQEYYYCAQQVLTLCERYAAQLLLNATPATVLSIGAQGVHLNSHRLMACTERPLPTDYWVAASCHNNEEIQQANYIKTDFIVLSPVQKTLSHSNVKPLGWHQFFQLTEQALCPVFALGGMTRTDVPIARTHGAQGIAAIRALFGNSALSATQYNTPSIESS